MTSPRFNGIYIAPNSPLYFRLHADGSAEGRFFDGQPDLRRASANLGVGIGGYATGRFEIEGDKAVLQLTFPFGERRYEGRVIDAGVELRFIQQGKDNPTKLYSFHELGDDELKPPQVTRAYLLRAKLAAGEVDHSRIETAAELGDPVAILALQPFLETERIAHRFASLGATACLRLLLAMTWSDDGDWYTPKQGLVTGGTRKDGEGKTLRALAKWCLKPEDKALAKAEQEFAEVVKIGAAAQFLELTLRVIKAPDEAGRAAGMKDALTLHLAQDPPAAYELARERVIPWLMGTGDPLAEMLKRIK